MFVLLKSSLIFLPDYDPELVPLPWACPWPARELSAEDAALWHMLSDYKLLDSLQPVDLRDPTNDPTSRLNREWQPPSAEFPESANSSQDSESRGPESPATAEPIGKPPRPRRRSTSSRL